VANLIAVRRSGQVEFRGSSSFGFRLIRQRRSREPRFRDLFLNAAEPADVYTSGVLDAWQARCAPVFPAFEPEF
jgi:hypothetical protein